MRAGGGGVAAGRVRGTRRSGHGGGRLGRRRGRSAALPLAGDALAPPAEACAAELAAAADCGLGSLRTARSVGGCCGRAADGAPAAAALPGAGGSAGAAFGCVRTPAGAAAAGAA